MENTNTSDDLQPFDRLSLGPDWDQAVRRDQLSAMVRMTPYLAAACSANSMLLAVILKDSVPRSFMMPWVAVALLMALYMAVNWWRNYRSGRRGSGSERAIRKAVILSAIVGLVWAAAAPLFTPFLDDRGQVFLYIVLSGMIAGGTIGLAAIPRASIAFAAPIVLVVLIFVIAGGKTEHLALAAMLVLFFLTTAVAQMGTPSAISANAASQYLRSLLTEILDMMPQGFVLFDANDRLLLCNNRYRDTLPELKEIIQPGLKFEDLARAMAEKGIVEIAEGGEESFVSDRLARHRKPEGPHEYYQTRGHWIRSNERVLSDGITIGMREDITDQKLAEEAAELYETTLTELIRIAPEAIITTDGEKKIEIFNQVAEQIFGYSADEVLGRHIDMLLPERYRDGENVQDEEPKRSGHQFRFMEERGEFFGLHKNGGEFPASASVAEMVVGGKKTFAVMARDISAQKSAELELRRSQERFQIIAEAVPVPTVITRKSDGTIIFANEAAAQFADREREAMLGRVSDDIWVDLKKRNQYLDRLEQIGRINDFEALVRRPDGIERSVLLSARFMEFDNEPVIFTSLVDITARKRAERTLQQSEVKYRDLVDGSIQGVLVHQDGKVVYANRAAGDIHGYDAEAMIGVPVQQLFPDDERERITRFRDNRTEGHIEFRVARPNGDQIWVEGFARNIYWEGNEARQNTFVNIDVRKKAQDALAESEERFRSVFDNAPIAIVLKDKEGRIQLTNRAYEEFFHRSADDDLGKTATELHHPDEAAWINSHDQKVMETTETETLEIELPRSDLQMDFVRITKFPVFNQAGDVTGIGTFASDITAEKSSETYVRQRQKMEAVGKLTGGIAHDFNNMLAAIIGYLELVEDDELVTDANRESISIALHAAYRAAELTHRLLAFSRQQTLNPKLSRVNEILPSFCLLAERTIGEDISIEMRLAANLWLTKVDPGELENALLNLTVNARDAMPGGGQLIFETKNHVQTEASSLASEELMPGSFVVISVSDTGTGMSPDVLDQVFEPYFTTKDVGEGSGLGLSMVFGFAKQSGGLVSIYSEEGIGTTVNIFLPKAEGEMQDSDIDEEIRQPSPTGDETILVVEDDKDVEGFLRIALERLGYTVLSAGDGLQAMEVMADVEDIDLLLTDVILPHGKNGRDVAEAFSERFPSAGVLYSSGYTRDILDGRAQLDKDVALINKPFQPYELAVQVREVLDNK